MPKVKKDGPGSGGGSEFDSFDNGDSKPVSINVLYSIYCILYIVYSILCNIVSLLVYICLFMYESYIKCIVYTYRMRTKNNDCIFIFILLYFIDGMRLDPDNTYRLILLLLLL